MDRLARTIEAIDAANAQDPNQLVVDGVARPKELVHAEMVSEWVLRLRPDAGDALRIAARGHHFRRWTVPRASYPDGRGGYLRWRRELHRRHVAELSDVLRDCGWDDETIARVGALVRKDGLGKGDSDVQTLEDAICLVFLETQLGELAARLDDDKMVDVLAKTAKKMSADALACAAGLRLDDRGAALLQRALEREQDDDAVARYLRALRERDWDLLRASLAADVERLGPYNDDYRGRDEYAAFLEATIGELAGYELAVDRITRHGRVAVVELSETIDEPDGRRLRTAEAIVFDLDDTGAIARVAVYLRASQHL